MKTHWRAVDLFTTAANRTLNDCRTIYAQQSAAGRLQSGQTAKLAVDAFHSRSAEALTQILQEVSNRVEHRGRAWRREMGEVLRALNEHLESAQEVLEPAFKKAKVDSGSARDAVLAILEWDAEALRKDHAAFRDGWTAPRPKKWQERHTFAYAIILLLIGGALGQAIPPIAKMLVQSAGIPKNDSESP